MELAALTHEQPAESRPATPDANPNDDPGLECDRRVNDQRLKSRFEQIFSKYEHDFTGVGDEIDLATGEIVVDNGHLQNMQDEADPGSNDSSRFVRAFAEHMELEDEEDDGSGQDESIDEGLDTQNDDHSLDAEEQDSMLDEWTASGSRGGSAASCSIENGSASISALNASVSSTSAIGNNTSSLLDRSHIQDHRMPMSQREQSVGTSESSSVGPYSMLQHMPALKESMSVLKSNAAEGNKLNTEAIQALGLSIANQIADFMKGNSHQPSNNLKRKDSTWDYPELPEDKRPRLQRSEPRPEGEVAPLQSESEVEPAGSVWAPVHIPDRLPKKKRKNKKQDAAVTNLVDPEQAEPVLKIKDSKGRTCSHCGIQASTAWRRGPDDTVLCNPCGIFWSKYGAMKPLEDLDYEDTDDAEGSEAYSANTSRPLADILSLDRKKQKYTPQEDALVIKLKEVDQLGWEAIASHFEGRGPWNLQGRYERSLKRRNCPGRDILIEQGYDVPIDALPFTAAEESLLLTLRDERFLGWEAIAERMASRSASALETQYNFVKNRTADGQGRRRGGPMYSAKEDDALRRHREVDGLTWEEIARLYPERSIQGLQKRYTRDLAKRKTQYEAVYGKGTFNVQLPVKPPPPPKPRKPEKPDRSEQDFFGTSRDSEEPERRRVRSVAPLEDPQPAEHAVVLQDPFNEAEDALIVKLREVDCLDWIDMSPALSGRSVESLKARYKIIQSTRFAEPGPKFTPEEDSLITSLVTKRLSWSQIAAQVGNHHSKKSVIEHWRRNLAPRPPVARLETPLLRRALDNRVASNFENPTFLGPATKLLDAFLGNTSGKMPSLEASNVTDDRNASVGPVPEASGQHQQMLAQGSSAQPLMATSIGALQTQREIPSGAGSGHLESSTGQPEAGISDRDSSVCTSRDETLEMATPEVPETPDTTMLNIDNTLEDDEPVAAERTQLKSEHPVSCEMVSAQSDKPRQEPPQPKHRGDHATTIIEHEHEHEHQDSVQQQSATPVFTSDFKPAAESDMAENDTRTISATTPNLDQHQRLLTPPAQIKHSFTTPGSASFAANYDSPLQPAPNYNTPAQANNYGHPYYMIAAAQNWPLAATVETLQAPNPVHEASDVAIDPLLLADEPQPTTAAVQAPQTQWKTEGRSRSRLLGGQAAFGLASLIETVLVSNGGKPLSTRQICVDIAERDTSYYLAHEPFRRSVRACLVADARFQQRTHQTWELVPKDPQRESVEHDTLSPYQRAAQPNPCSHVTSQDAGSGRVSSKRKSQSQKRQATLQRGNELSIPLLSSGKHRHILPKPQIVEDDSGPESLFVAPKKKPRKPMKPQSQLKRQEPEEDSESDNFIVPSKQKARNRTEWRGLDQDSEPETSIVSPKQKPPNWTKSYNCTKQQEAHEPEIFDTEASECSLPSPQLQRSSGEGVSKANHVAAEGPAEIEDYDLQEPADNLTASDEVGGRHLSGNAALAVLKSAVKVEIISHALEVADDMIVEEGDQDVLSSDPPTLAPFRAPRLPTPDVMRDPLSSSPPRAIAPTTVLMSSLAQPNSSDKTKIISSPLRRDHKSSGKITYGKAGRARSGDIGTPKNAASALLAKRLKGRGSKSTGEPSTPKSRTESVRGDSITRFVPGSTRKRIVETPIKNTLYNSDEDELAL